MDLDQVQDVLRQADRTFTSNPNLVLGIRAAIAGGEAALGSYNSEDQQPNRSGQRKGDIASAIAIATELHAADPTSRKLCEEPQGSRKPVTGAFPSSLPGHPTWEIDPVDPSRSLSAINSGEQNGLPERFTVMLARRYMGEVWEAIIYDPVQDELVFAVKDQGAWMSINGGEPIKLKVSDYSQPSQIRAFRSLSNPNEDLEQLLKTAGINSIVHFPGVGGKAVEIACGGVDWSSICREQKLEDTYLERGGDLYLTSGRKRCDVAAAALILEEAGGKATTHNGERLIELLQERRVMLVDSLLLSNTAYHGQALKLCPQRRVH